MSDTGLDTANAQTRALGFAGGRLEGVEAIADYLRCTINGVYCARRIGSLPIRRLGRKGALYSRIEITMNVYGHLFPDQRADHDLADAIDRQLKAAT